MKSNDHPPHHHLEREVEIGEPAQRFRVAANVFRRRRLAVGGHDAHAHEHRLRHVFGHRALERDIARREPHLLVTRLFFPARFVACVRLEETVLKMRDRRAVDALCEVSLQLLDVDRTDHRAETLDRPDARQRADGRPRYALTQQILRLRDVREGVGPLLDRRVENVVAEQLAMRLLPRLRRGYTIFRARRHVAAVVGEPAVTANSARDERLGHVVVREQLDLGPLQLEVAHDQTVYARVTLVPTGPAAAPAQARPRSRRDPARREAVLQAAAEAFAHAGYAATSMDEIAATAGITKLIVYRHFEAKETLYRAVLEQVFDRQVELFLANIAQGLEAEGSTRALLEVAREWPDGFRLLWRHAAREPQFGDYALSLRDVAVNAARGVVTPLVAPELAEWAAQALFDHLVDAVLDWLDHGDAAHDDDFIALETSALRATVAAWATTSSARRA